jgi:sporulation protein YlmC with PRC-barrel domain
MLPENQIEMIPGTDVYDTEGAKIGRAGTVYVDDDTGKPEWATVHTGLLGTRESFMPISRAELHGDRLTVPYTKQQVKDAPSLDPDGGHLSLRTGRGRPTPWRRRPRELPWGEGRCDDAFGGAAQRGYSAAGGRPSATAQVRRY